MPAFGEQGADTVVSWPPPAGSLCMRGLQTFWEALELIHGERNGIKSGGPQGCC